MDWLNTATGIDFTMHGRAVEPFSQAAFDSYLSALECQTLETIRHYLSVNCGVSKVPDDTRFLLARYFMSFLPAAGLSEFRFDPQRYLELNPDVKAAGVDPYRHYLQYGVSEGRRVT